MTTIELTDEIRQDEDHDNGEGAPAYLVFNNPESYMSGVCAEFDLFTEYRLAVRRAERNTDKYGNGKWSDVYPLFAGNPVE